VTGLEVLRRIELRRQQLPVTLDFYLLADEYAALFQHMDSMRRQGPYRSRTLPDDAPLLPPIMCYGMHIHPIMSVSL
jgi:hypothetical protein